MEDTRAWIIPEPKERVSTGKRFPFDGFSGFPDFLAGEFGIPKGRWKITKADRPGTGLLIEEEKITIWGDETMCHASIIQLLKQDCTSLPEIRIREAPAFKIRGYHLDIARDGVPTLETFKKLLRWLFLLKYNYFGIYLEDLFPWRSHPRIGLHRGRPSEQEYREIIEYGSQLGIVVFPSLNLCGHMEHILSINQYHAFSEWHRLAEGCLDVSNEKAREFTYELLREAVDFFPSELIHIGGDESWALGRGKSLDKNWRYDGPELYRMHHENMIKIVAENGKKPVIWGDLLCGSILMGDMISREAAAKWGTLLKNDLWREAVVANWDYSPDPKHDFNGRIRIFKDRGIEQLACPSLRNSDKYYPAFDRALANNTNFLKAAREESLPGFLITAWASECLFSYLDPLVLAAMEIAEGRGEWREKWCALTGESEKVLDARLLLGESYDATYFVKQALFKGYCGRSFREEDPNSPPARWRSILEETAKTELPEDLHFIRKMMEMGIKALDGSIRPSDYIMLSRLYAHLWLKERKPQGLGRYVSKFWSMAGKADAGLLEDNTGFVPIPLRF